MAARWFIASPSSMPPTGASTSGSCSSPDRRPSRPLQELKRLNETLEERVAQEVAERLKAEEALRQAQKMEAIGQLTGGIAHDFNNLLTIIVGNIELLQRRLPEGADRLQRAATHAMEATRRAATLTQRLLAFSRRQPLDPKPIDVNKLVAGMSDLLRRTLGEVVVLETVLAGGLWRSQADPNQLENAILNLAVNARDAMPDGGKLTIETANARLDEAYVEALAEPVPAGQYVLVAVSDTGTGMDKATMEKVFEPFFTTKEAGQGNRTRPEPGVRLRPAVQRSCQDLQRAGRGHDDQDLPAPPDRLR